MAKTWKNSDGLYVKSGVDEATRSVAGESMFDGMYHDVEFTIQAMTSVVSAGGATAIVDDNFMFPTGARIEKCEVIVETACTGTGATLDIGLIRYDRSTELDYNGIVAAQILSTLTPAGTITTHTAGSTYAGALLGTTTANPGYLTINYNTAAYTAGKVVVRIFWRKPVNVTA